MCAQRISLNKTHLICFFSHQYTMEWLIIAAIVVIIIAIVIYRAVKRRECFGGTDIVACGLSGVVKLPDKPLDRFMLIPNCDSAVFAPITGVQLPPDFGSATYSAKHSQLADLCDKTPGCSAFNSAGDLYYAVVPEQAMQTRAYTTGGCSGKTCGLFVRRCSEPIPLVAAFYAGDNYTGARILLGPGNYPSLSAAGFKNDSISSIRVPVGLRVAAYTDANYKGLRRVFYYGDYPKLDSILKKSINNAISSVKIYYDPLSTRAGQISE